MPFIASTIAKQRPGRHADGGGLYLEVKAADGVRKAIGRYWMFRYRDGAIVRWKSLGVFPAVTLQMAREKARSWRDALYHGKDPFKAAAIPTFAAAADSFLAVNASGWSNARHREQWVTTLGDAYCAPLRALPVDVIESHVLEVLSPIWHSKAETARRLRGRIEAVLDYAKSKGWRTTENPARWRGCLKGPLSNVRRERKHHAALPFDQVPAFVATLREKDTLSAMVLEFIILTAARSGEVLQARWSEIDLAQATWTIPASRMKARREHVVPLSGSVLALLQPLAEIHTAGDFVFPGPLSGSAIKRLARDAGVTVHGFRSSFSDWAGERTTFQSEVIEFALAHSIPDRAKAAYRRYRALEKRRKLMESWARHCDGASNVLPLRMLS